MPYIVEDTAGDLVLVRLADGANPIDEAKKADIDAVRAYAVTEQWVQGAAATAPQGADYVATMKAILAEAKTYIAGRQPDFTAP
jgi:hypothetical protein